MSRAELRAWVEQALAKTGETASGLARKAGLATTTLTRFLADDGSPMLGLRSIAKIAHAAGMPPPFALPAGAAPGGLGESEATRYQPTPRSPLADALAALTQGHNATDPWKICTRALEQRGVLPGDIVLVDLNARPDSGALVCAQVYEWSKGTAETVFRVYEPPYLVAAAADPALAEKLRRPLLVDNERVVIKGVVTGCLRLATAA